MSKDISILLDTIFDYHCQGLSLAQIKTILTNDIPDADERQASFDIIDELYQELFN